MYKRRVLPILLAVIMTLAVLLPAQVTKAEPNVTWEFYHVLENGHLPRLTTGEGLVEGKLLIDGSPAPAGTTVILYVGNNVEDTATTDSRGEFQLLASNYTLNQLLDPSGWFKYVPLDVVAVLDGTESPRQRVEIDRYKTFDLDTIRGEVIINFVDSTGTTVESKTIVTRKYEDSDTFEFFPDEPAIAAPALSPGCTWEKEGNQAPDIDENNQVNVAGITGLANSETWTYTMVQTAETGTLHLVFVDENNVAVDGSPIDVTTIQNENGEFVPYKTSVEALELAEGYEWTTEDEGAVAVDENNVILLSNVALDSDDVIWTYKMAETQITGVLNLVFVDENGDEVDGSPITLTTTKSTEGKFITFETAVEAPKLPEGYAWEAETVGAAEVNDENYIDLFNVEFDDNDVTWTYKMIKAPVKGVLHLIFVDKNGIEVDASPIEVTTTQNEDGVFIPDETSVEALALIEGYEWISEDDGAVAVDENNVIVLSDVALDSDDITWTYKMVKIPVKGVLHLVFLDENGDEVDGSPIEVTTTQNPEGKFLTDETEVNAPALEDGYKWVAETEGAVAADEEGKIDLYWAELEEDDVTWTYKKTSTVVPEEKGVLHLVFVDENGDEVEGSPIEVTTTQNKGGKFLTDKTEVNAPELENGYVWVAETEGAVAVDEEGKINLYWAELEEDDVTWTYKKTSTVVPEEKGALHLVFVDENGKEVDGSPIDLETKQNTEGKYLTDETEVNAPELEDGYVWLAETEGAVEVSDEGKIDLYWVELDEDDVTWKYKKTAIEDKLVVLEATFPSGKIKLEDITIDDENLTESVKEALENKAGEGYELLLICEELDKFDEPITNENLIKDRDNYYFDIYLVLRKAGNPDIVLDNEIKAKVTVTINGEANRDAKAFVANKNDVTPVTLTLEEITPVNVKGENYSFEGPHFSYYVLSFGKAEEKPDTPDQPVTPEKPEQPETPQKPSGKYPWVLPPRNVHGWLNNMSRGKVAVVKPDQPGEAKVDSAKLPKTLVTTIPATGEARVPMTTIGLLLAAATALFLIRRKTR